MSTTVINTRSLIIAYAEANNFASVDDNSPTGPMPVRVHAIDNSYGLRDRSLILSRLPAGFVFCVPWVNEGPSYTQKTTPTGCLLGLKRL
jgi:hypothetical protein